MGMWIVDSVGVGLVLSTRNLQPEAVKVTSRPLQPKALPVPRARGKSSTRYRISPFRGQLPILRASNSNNNRPATQLCLLIQQDVGWQNKLGGFRGREATCRGESTKGPRDAACAPDVPDRARRSRGGGTLRAAAVLSLDDERMIDSEAGRVSVDARGRGRERGCGRRGRAEDERRSRARFALSS